MDVSCALMIICWLSSKMQSSIVCKPVHLSIIVIMVFAIPAFSLAQSVSLQLPV